MKLFRKKKALVLAERWDGNLGEINRIISCAYSVTWNTLGNGKDVAFYYKGNLTGRAEPGDWIVRDSGKFRGMKDGDFFERYEPVSME